MRSGSNPFPMKRILPGRLSLFIALLTTSLSFAPLTGRADNPAPAAPAPAPAAEKAGFAPTPPPADEPQLPPPPSAEALMTPARQKELFDALDLAGPALKPVRAAVKKGDYAAAEHAWADYLRQRTNVPWTFTLHGQTADFRHPIREKHYTNEVADNAVNGKVTGGLVQIYCSAPNQNFDWFYNPTKEEPPLNYEWQWQLCRTGFWSDMAHAYRATGDERYPQAWAQQLCSFVNGCPVPDKVDNAAPSAWRTIDTGIRMLGSWPASFFSYLESPSLSDADLAVYTASCLDQGRYLRKFQTSGNWITMEMNGLYTDGSVFPEFKEAKDWRTYAANKLNAQEVVQILPDGAHFELSTGYHNVALDNFAGLAETAKRMGRVAELPAGYVSRLEKAFAYNLYLMTPDRSLPRFNDSWHVGVDGVMKRAFAFFPDRTDFEWVATDGTAGAPPKITSYFFPYAGFVAMRSGWDREANYAAFRLGPIGTGHMQQDKLDFLIWAYGTEVLFSSGGGSYEHSKWHSYATDTYSHNCVMVDGQAQRRQTKNRMANVSKEPIDARWQTTPKYDFASGIYDQGYGTETDRIATQVRRVLFVKPDIFVVADTLTPHDAAEHTYQARWQLLPTQTHQDPVSNEVTTMAPGQPNLAIVPLNPQNLEVKAVSAQTDPELLGWNVRKDLVPEYVPATTVLHTKKGPGVQNFLTLFIPIKPGDPEPVKSVTPRSTNSALVTLADGRTLLISAYPKPGGNLSVSETLADGKKGRQVSSK
jgi:hypothetical protein